MVLAPQVVDLVVLRFPRYCSVLVMTAVVWRFGLFRLPALASVHLALLLIQVL